MKWLLWKDYRHNRLIVFAGLAILLAPYLIGVCVGCVERWWWHPSPRPTPWCLIFVGAGFYSLAISQLTIALMGGNALAGERVDRSAEFLYILPVTRRKFVISKLLLTSLIAVIIWLNAPLLSGLMQYVMERGPKIDDMATICGNVAITGLMFFCVAWFLSAFIASPTFAVCGGLISPLLILLGFQFVSWLMYLSTGHWPNDTTRIVQQWFRGICLALAPICFVLGTWRYLRRVEP